MAYRYKNITDVSHFLIGHGEIKAGEEFDCEFPVHNAFFEEVSVKPVATKPEKDNNTDKENE